MFKHTALFAGAAILALGVPNNSPSTSGSWQVDARHSDVQLITDATTDYGKTKIDMTLGFARVSGRVRLDDADPAKSTFDLSVYPANSMAPAIDEEGKLKSQWLENLSNHTLVCFHSKGVLRTRDGRLQTTGSLVLTRVDRNLDATPSEAYAGPVYGAPVIHRVSREATFVFDLPTNDGPANAGKNQKDEGILTSGSTSMFREDFPQLVRAVVSTYWPPVVQDKTCQAATGGGEDYHGSQCTGTFLEAPALPQAPYASNAEDYPGPSNFNAMVGNHLTIRMRLRLTPRSSAEPAAGGN